MSTITDGSLSRRRKLFAIGLQAAWLRTFTGASQNGTAMRVDPEIYIEHLGNSI
jgi:hypothetical protein